MSVIQLTDIYVTSNVFLTVLNTIFGDNNNNKKAK